jgi:hypothetical protein
VRARFARHFGRSPADVGPEEVRAYQLYLLHDRHASWSTFNQAVSAWRLLYRLTRPRPFPVEQLPYGKRPQSLPAVLSRGAVAQLFVAEPRPVYRLLLQTTYAAGLRASEAEQRRAVRDLLACRTAALGGHAYRCDGCGHEEIASNSCRNRHGPKCQESPTAAWLRREASYLLPVPYDHVVFTLPAAVAGLVWQNRRLGYGLLFRAVQETLREVAANPRHLGAAVGVLTVRHTWDQDLPYHPHIHAVVTGGGLSCGPGGRVGASPR